MAAKFKFVDDVKDKCKDILESLQVYEHRDLLADELKSLISAHALKELIEDLPEEKQKEFNEKLNSNESEKYLIEFRGSFKEDELKEVYLRNFKAVIKEFISKAFPRIDSITLEKVNSILNA